MTGYTHGDVPHAADGKTTYFELSQDVDDAPLTRQPAAGQVQRRVTYSAENCRRNWSEPNPRRIAATAGTTVAAEFFLLEPNPLPP